MRKLGFMKLYDTPGRRFSAGAIQLFKVETDWEVFSPEGLHWEVDSIYRAVILPRNYEKFNHLHTFK